MVNREAPGFQGIVAMVLTSDRAKAVKLLTAAFKGRQPPSGDIQEISPQAVVEHWVRICQLQKDTVRVEHETLAWLHKHHRMRRGCEGGGRSAAKVQPRRKK